MLVLVTESGLTLGSMATTALAMLMTPTHIREMVLVFTVKALFAIRRASLWRVFGPTVMTTSLLVSRLRPVL